MRNRTWMVLLAGMAAVLLGAALFLHSRNPGTIANIYQDGTCVYSIDLETVTEAYSFEITDQSGHSNTILVEPGRICVSEANCPDQICVNSGWADAMPVVCLPAKLVIELEREAKAEEQAIDGVTG